MDKIVMVDLDGVVLNSQYKTTGNICSITDELSKVSHIVPNSDTPIERLATFFEQSIGISSDIVIGENGAVVKYFDDVKFTYENIDISQYIHAMKTVFSRFDCCILECDAPILVREHNELRPNTKFILIDKFRRMSISMFFLVTDDDGKLHIDEEWSEQCLHSLSPYNKPQALGNFVYNPKYGIAISSITGVSKTSGYLFLKQKYPNAQFFMVGDSDADIIEDASVTHLAVNNASSSLKKESSFVSNNPYTIGLGDCFQWILKQ